MTYNLPRWAQKQDATLIIFLAVLWYSAAIYYLRQPIPDKGAALILCLFGLVGMSMLTGFFAVEQWRKVSRWIYVAVLIVGLSPWAAFLLYARYYLQRP